MEHDAHMKHTRHCETNRISNMKLQYAAILKIARILFSQINELSERKMFEATTKKKEEKKKKRNETH